MDSENVRVVFDEVRGYRRLDPLPNARALRVFYESEYARVGSSSAPDIQRLRCADERESSEQLWRFSTIYSDVMHYVERCGLTNGTAVDVGCGTGEFLRFVAQAGGHGGWKAVGVEPNRELVELARNRGLRVVDGRLDGLGEGLMGEVDLITMFNVLEHVLEPLDEVEMAVRLLKPGGVVVVQVPNDFSLLQESVRAYLGAEPWWIVEPDHVNYFGFSTLRRLLERAGLKIRFSFATFPMEFFLLAGLDYLSDAEVGRAAHQRRCEFEMSMSGEVRRRLGEDFASAGIGRNCVVVAELPE